MMSADGTRKRLFDMQIDEVSIVDRPANQHGLISFAKADDGEEIVELTGIIDEDGNEVDLSTLEPGTEIEDDEGNVYEIVGVEESGDGEDVDPDDGEAPSVDEDDDALAAVGKAGGFMSGLMDAARAGRKAQAGAGKTKVKGLSGKAAEKAGFGQGAAFKLGASYERNPLAYQAGAAGTAAAGVGAGAYGYSQYKKNAEGDGMSTYQEQVLEELSKAVSESEREQVIAKMASDVELAHARANEAIEFAKGLEAERVTEAFIAKAASYNLPVDPVEFGPIIMKMASVLDDDEFDLVDKVFTAVGDTLYSELGYVGGGDNASVLDQVDSLAEEMVGKADGEFSKAEAAVALFAANPDAYDAYLAEQA